MNVLNKDRRPLIRKIIIGTFAAVPILSSVISAIHLVQFFNLGNQSYMAYVLSAAFEIGSVASFLILGILTDIKRWMLWSVFFILCGMQILGNVFFSYDYVFQQLKVNPNWLQSFNSFMNYFSGNDAATNMIVLAFLIGLPIPLISLFFLKSTSDYLHLNRLENNFEEPKKEIPNDLSPRDLGGNKFDEDHLKETEKYVEIFNLKQELKKSQDEQGAKVLWIQELNEIIDNLKKEKLKEEVNKDTVELDVNSDKFWDLASDKDKQDDEDIYNKSDDMNPAFFQNNNIK